MATYTPNIFDDFTNLDGWHIYWPGQGLGQTWWGGQPKIFPEPNGNRFVRLYLSPYDPGGVFFKGTEIHTRRQFGLDKNAVTVFEARLRLRLWPGAVAGFYPYGPERRKEGDEIDFEYLGKLLPQAGHKLWTPSYNGHINKKTKEQWRDGSQKMGINPAVSTSETGKDWWREWNEYRIEWRRDRIDWYLNGRFLRRETNKRVIPNEVMSVHLNIWAAQPEWDEAYSPSYKPLKSLRQANKKLSYMDVDWVQVGIQK